MAVYKHFVVGTYTVKVVNCEHYWYVVFFYCPNNRKGDVTVNKVDMNNIRMFLFNESRNIFFRLKRIENAKTCLYFLKRGNIRIKINI